MSYVQLLFHTVIRTKSSQKTLSLQYSDDLYRYIWKIFENNNCRLFRINGMEDHIHLFFSLHPSISLSDFLRELKVETSKMLKRTKGFENFKAWGEGYAALSYSRKEKDAVIQYIMNQREHHKKVTFREEYIDFLKEMGLELDERHWEK